MLYEVITKIDVSSFAGRKPTPVQQGSPFLNIITVGIVITSYSIHYTKLYDFANRDRE